MVETSTAGLVGECFWPGVAESDLRALDKRLRASTADLQRRGEPLRYLGSILLRVDEVVLCQFQGTAAAVREVAERSRVPFERILESTITPASVPGEGRTDA
jgi:hypothetical protein